MKKVLVCFSVFYFQEDIKQTKRVVWNAQGEKGGSGMITVAMALDF